MPINNDCLTEMPGSNNISTLRPIQEITERVYNCLMQISNSNALKAKEDKNESDK